MNQQNTSDVAASTTTRKWWSVWISIPMFLALVLIPMIFVFLACQAGVNALLALFAAAIALTVLLTVGEYTYGRGTKMGMINHADIASAFFGFMLTGGILNGFVVVLLAPLSSSVSEVLHISLWPGSWPIWLQVLIGAAISDLAMWPIHHYMHKHGSLWRVHVIHHSVSDLRPIRAFMQHPFEVFLLGVIPAIPLILLGAPPITIVLVGTLRVVVGIIDHSTMPLRTGWLDWIIHTPNDHWWHHNLEDSGGTNFTTVVIPIDVAFQSFTKPPKVNPVPASIGIPTPTINPNRYLNQCSVPFRWSKVEAEGHS